MRGFNLFSILKVFYLFSIVFILTSCSTRRDILVNLDTSLNKESIQVDFVGASDATILVLNKSNYYQYWKTAGLRKKYKGSEYEINFPPFSYVFDMTIDRSNHIWDTWDNLDSEYLFIAVDVPIKQSDKIEWKKAVYLQSYSWYNFWSDRNLYVYVNANGLTIKNE